MNDGLDIKPRNSHTMVYDESEEKLIFFGGADDKGPLNEILYYDLMEEKLFKYDEIKGLESIEAREMHTCHIFAGKM